MDSDTPWILDHPRSMWMHYCSLSDAVVFQGSLLNCEGCSNFFTIPPGGIPRVNILTYNKSAQEHLSCPLIEFSLHAITLVCFCPLTEPIVSVSLPCWCRCRLPQWWEFSQQRCALGQQRDVAGCLHSRLPGIFPASEGRNGRQWWH